MSAGPRHLRAARTQHRLRLPAQGTADGLVVQAVLLTVLVATIGLVTIVNRVAASRSAASSGSLSAAARQAAEVGYSEFMTEMNRDSKSYLWVTKFDQWGLVTQADLNTCSVGTMAAPSANPIAGVSSAVNIGPALTTVAGATINPLITISYRLIDYRVPDTLSTPPAQPDCSKFGNLYGGTSMITIVGTASRATGEATSFTLKRTISVLRVPSLFNNPLFFTPRNRTGVGATVTASDIRFPNYPAIPTLASYDVTCRRYIESGNNVAAAPYDIQCIAPGLEAGLFRSNNSPAPSTNRYFPYLANGTLWSACTQAATAVQCAFSSLSVSNTASDDTPSLPVLMSVDTTASPVEFYLTGTLAIDTGSLLNGSLSEDPDVAGNDWKNFRIFADDRSGCNARINVNSYSVGTANFSNLQNTFVWLRCGTVANLATNLAPIAGVPGLIGWASTITNAQPVPNTATTIAPRFVYEGLGGPYGFNGIFTGDNRIRFQYRGYGFYEQSPNLP